MKVAWMLLLLLAPAQDGTLTLTDPPEAQPVKSGDKPGLDIDSVRLESDGRKLQIRIKFTDDLLTILKAQAMGTCGAELNFDTDGDDKTGAVAWDSPKLGGFEVHLRAFAGVTYDGGGKAVEGGMTGKDVTGIFGTYRLIPCKTGETFFDAKVRLMRERPMAETKVVNEAHDKASRIDGKELVLDVPYAELGVASGKKIRVLVKEPQAMGRAADIFLPEGVLTLK